MNTRKRHAQRIAYYCSASKQELLDRMDFYTVNEIGGYLGVLLRPGSKVLAVAHMDFLGSGKVHTCDEEQVVCSALDDRLGVYAALEALPALGVQCDVLLCDDEESANSSIASVGMGFIGRYNWIIELDCSGVRAVTYGYKGIAGCLGAVWDNVSGGAFSDISSIEHVSPVSGFNAGVGYHMQHGESCYVKIAEFQRAMAKVAKFYAVFKDVRFEENARTDGIVVENKPYYNTWNSKYEGSGNTGDAYDPLDNDKYDVYDYGACRRPDPEDPADRYITRHRDGLLDGGGGQEFECCEMCSAILMPDEVYLYQGFPVCEEHYFVLVADDIDGAPEACMAQDAWDDDDTDT